MNLHRGDVVIVDFNPTDPKAKVRPALVVQNDRDNSRMRRTIVVQITSNVTASTKTPNTLWIRRIPTGRSRGCGFRP